MKKRALVSVFDKVGILEFCRGLEKLDWEIVSTGGTYKYLKENGVNALDISEVTKFPEMLDGRVKTLHPLIHGGILFRREDSSHVETVKEYGIHSIDMVVNNLYPFEAKLREGAEHSEMVENIDIGGPSMIRAAAKNYKDVLIVTDPSDYEGILYDLERGEVSEKSRMNLAGKAYSYTAFYDSLIANYFNEKLDITYPSYLTMPYKLEDKLRYGENPHQSAAYYKNSYLSGKYTIRQLHGKEMSYNNLIDVFGGVKAVKEFDKPAVVAIKHTNPCGVGCADNIFEAYMNAYESDMESIFGGIVAFNREVDAKSAAHMGTFFLEIVIAPSFSETAIDILTRKKNIRLIEIKELNDFGLDKMAFKQVLGGIVYQEYDVMTDSEKEFEFKVVTKRQPTEKEIEDLKFAWLCVKNVASNGVVIAKDGATVGIGQGEVRRSWAVEEAIARAENRIEDAVLASDAFFFEDTVEQLHEAGIKAVMSPGGSVKDEAVIELCDKYDMTLVFTGVRHFRH